PHARNISDSTQPYRPRAYSLTIRQAGSNSGLRTCRLASNRRVTAEALSTRRAAGSDTLVTSLSEMFLFRGTGAVVVTVALPSDYVAGASAPPFTRDVGASDPIRTSPRWDFCDLSA